MHHSPDLPTVGFISVLRSRFGKFKISNQAEKPTSRLSRLLESVGDSACPRSHLTTFRPSPCQLCTYCLTWCTVTAKYSRF
jgi:hypothetical protein